MAINTPKTPFQKIIRKAILVVCATALLLIAGWLWIRQRESITGDWLVISDGDYRTIVRFNDDGSFVTTMGDKTLGVARWQRQGNMVTIFSMSGQKDRQFQATQLIAWDGTKLLLIGDGGQRVLQRIEEARSSAAHLRSEMSRIKPRHYMDHVKDVLGEPDFISTDDPSHGLAYFQYRMYGGDIVVQMQDGFVLSARFVPQKGEAAVAR